MMDTELCKRLEHFETPRWAADAILAKEVITRFVVDPCCGAGVLSEAAKDFGAEVASYDIHDWGYPLTDTTDFLSLRDSWMLPSGFNLGFTALMNPPFSLATQFVENCINLGADKIICFQRFAWWESAKRRQFWQKHPPSRVYICGDRADCWRHDIPLEKRGSGTPTAHAWFVWDRGLPTGTLLGHVYKADTP